MDKDARKVEPKSKLYVVSLMAGVLFLFAAVFSAVPNPTNDWQFVMHTDGVRLPQLIVGLTLLFVGLFFSLIDIVVEPSHDLVLKNYARLPMTHRRALEAVNRSVTGVLTQEEIARLVESFPPTITMPKEEWLSVLLDLVDMGLLEMEKPRDKAPKYKLPNVVSRVFIREDISDS